MTSVVCTRGVSLIVATLGRSCIRTLLDSLQAQTCQDFECIVVDGSADGRSEPLVRGYPRTLYVRSTRSGNSAIRNIGIDYARREILGFPDDDCYYDPNTVEEVLRGFRTCEQSVAGVSGLWMDTISRRPALGGRRRRHATIINIWSSITNITMFLRSDVVRKVGGYDEQFGLGSGSFEGGEETDLALKIFGAGKHILFTPDVRIWHPQDRHDLHMPEKQWGYEEAWGALFRKWSRPGRIGPSILVSAAWFI
ncbi:MAG: glycosyltransferase, partial [Bacteroidota bacterium]